MLQIIQSYFNLYHNISILIFQILFRREIKPVAHSARLILYCFMAVLLPLNYFKFAKYSSILWWQEGALTYGCQFKIRPQYCSKSKYCLRNTAQKTGRQVGWDGNEDLEVLCPHVTTERSCNCWSCIQAHKAHLVNGLDAH